MRHPVAVVLAGIAVLIGLVLGAVLDPSVARLPGVDSINLYTWEVYTRTALSDGQLPFWNPYHFAGTPHLADPQTTVLYPPALLLRWLPVPAFLGWMIALHLWIAGAGSFFAARVLGMGWLVAATVAVAVMLGGSVPGWIHNGHLLLIYSAAWVPWAFGLAIVSVRSGRLLPSGWLVVVLALQFLAGYLQGTLYLAAAVSLYFVFSAVWPDESNARVPRWTPLAQLVLLGMLCAAAAAFQLLPTAALVAEAGRSSGLPYEDALEGSWQLRDLSTLLFPFFGANDLPYRVLSDRLAYVGWILTAFAPFAFFSRERLRIATFLGLLVAAVYALALGDTLGVFRLHHALFPGLRIPGRVLFLATVGLGLLGGLGLDAFIACARGRDWRRLTIPAAVSGAALAAATYVVIDARAATLPGPGWPWLPMALGGGVLVVAAAALTGSPRIALSLALMAVVVDLTTLNARAAATIAIDAASDVRQWIGPPTGGRALSLCEHRISARELLLNGEPNLDGPPGLHLAGYGDWVALAKHGNIPPRDGLYRRIGSDGEVPVRRDLVDLLNVTRVISCGDDVPGAALVVRPNEHAWPRAVWICGVEDVARPQLIARLLQGRYAASGELRPRHYLQVRWPPAMEPARRIEVEHRHRLEDGVLLEGTTWRYALGDPSAEAVLAIVQDPDVEDTHGVDRATGAIRSLAAAQAAAPPSAGDDQERQTLVGTAPCPVRGDVVTTEMDRADGYVSARVHAPADGWVFLSEPYYPRRRAYVDGRRVPALRADLAFTAVAVPAGDHQVELRYTPMDFYVGSAVSGMTGVGYAAAALVRRRRRMVRA